MHLKENNNTFVYRAEHEQNNPKKKTLSGLLKIAKTTTTARYLYSKKYLYVCQDKLKPFFETGL